MGPKSNIRRAPPQRGGPAKKAKKSEKKTDFTLGGWDDDIDSDEGENSGKKSKDDDDDSRSGSSDSDEDSEDAMETAEQKRRRLAKEYLARMEGDGSSSGGSDEEEDDENNKDSTMLTSKNKAISMRLRKERLDAGGRYFRDLAGTAQSNAAAIEAAPRATMNGHDLSVTCVALATNESFALSGSKDNSVIKWDVETQQKTVLRAKWSRATHFEKQASDGEVLSVAISSDGRYCVSAGRDKMIRIYDARAGNAEVKALGGHGAAVTSLAFRRESYSLFSGSVDRCLKHWDLSEMGYLETLFGHQDGVTAIDCWTKERPISVSSDRTVRYWKVVDESHLVFRGHKSSVDSVQLLTNESFLTGGQEGSLHLWKETQKKPIVSISNAHGFEKGNSSFNANWISCVASVKMSNLAATGSNDGYVRLWNASAEKRALQQVAAIPAPGFVNAIAMSPRIIVFGSGREHRMGRWWCEKGSKNKLTIMRFPLDLDNEDDDDGKREESDSESESGSGSGEFGEEEEEEAGSERSDEN